MAVKYKQKCVRCKKNYVLASSRNKYILCYDCQKDELHGEVKDPNMKKFFDIPEEFYKDNSFLRDIKIKYIKFENLTDRQIEAFSKTVKELTEKKKVE